MRKPLTAFFRPLLLALTLGMGYTARAQVTYSQVPLTASSFNADVVANGTAAAPPASSTTADVDGGGYYFMSQDYYTATTAHTSGIPNSGLIPNSISGYSALTYQLASLSANNSLRIAGGAIGTGSITFATPTAASEVYVLASSGSGISTVDMTVNYSDGTTTVFSAQSVPDWFTASTTLNVFGMTGRASTTTPVSTPYTAPTPGTAPFFDQIKLTIPGNKSTTTITGISFAKTSTAGYLQVMAVSIGTYPACTAPPTAGTATASATSLCAGGTTTLSLTGINAAAGLTYQWQSSTTSATAGFANITGATSSTYTTPALTQTTYYRAVVTCSGQSANSAVATVTVQGPTYATVPYTQGFENTWLSRCDTDEAPDASWVNTPATGNASWRREDDGASAGWTSITNGAYTPTGSNAGGASSSHSARFHNYSASNGTIGTLDLYVNVTGGTGTPTLKFDYRNSDSNAVVVQLSTDGGATFPTTLQTLGTQAAWTSYTVSLPSTVTATTVIRFKDTSNFGFNDTGIDNVSVSYIACAAATGLAATTTAAGATASASITFTPVTGATTYTFGISPAVTGAPTSVTASPISLTGLAYSTTYTVTLTTNCGSTTAQAATYTFTTPCIPATYATIPYTQGFESAWLSRCGTNDVPDNNWANTPVTGNNSWRRNDDGTSGGWGSTNGAYTPGGSTANGASSTFSARFHSYNATSGTTGNFDYYVNLSPAGSKRLTFDYINTSGTDKLVVLLSTDGGATFGATALTTQTTAATWTSVTVDFAATSATSILRFQATSDFGATDIGLDNVSVNLTPACASPNSVVVTTTGTTTTATFYSPTAANGYTVTTTPATTTYTVAQSATGTATATLTGLTLNTTYTVTAAALCANGSTAATTSAPFLVTPYCNPPHSSGNTGSITNISIASTSFSNATFSTPPSGTYYTAYPASVVTTTLQQGSTYSFTVNLSGTYSTTLWIDYDRNNVFDTGEGVQVIPIAGATTGTASFTVPTTAALGATGLRIRTRSSGSANGPSDACTTFGSGETQDYVVTIVAPSPIDVQAAALVAPAAGTSTSCYSSTEAVTVTVRNLGTSALNFTTTPLTVTVNVTGAVTQTLTTTINTNAANGGNPLASGSTVNITLPTTLNMTALGTYTFAATATVPGDGNTANDALTPQTRIVAAPVAGTLAVSNTSLCISGTATLTLTGAANGGIQLQSSPDNVTFTDITGATGTTFTTPVLTATTYYRAQVRCNTGTVTSNVSTITVNNPQVATTNSPVAICAGSTATLTATGSTGTTLRFFDVATGGTALATGTTFTTPALTASKQYFVEAASGSTESVGRPAPAATTNTTAFTYGLVFTAASSFTLTSVDVYPTSTAGNLVVQVQDNTGTLIPGLTATVAIPAGTGTTAFTVPLNFNIPAGTGMRLMAISSPSLVRESSVGGFPYTSPSGNVSITSGYISGTSTTYYFFYNWQVSTICVGATRTPIQVNVSQPATATFSYPATGSNCAGSTGTIAATLASGSTAGTFTSTTGLTINATTGAVNLATSTAGTYTVTNTLPASGNCGVVTATATITVNPTPARPTLTATYNGTVTTLTSSAATGNQFYFNGTAIPGATGQTYVVNGSASTYGSYTVVATNSFGCSSQASVIQVVTTTKGSIAGASLLVYPNPTPTGQVTLELSGFRSTTQLAVIDALGRVVRAETLPATAGTVTHALDLSHMASGVYMLRLTNADGVETRRLVRE